MWVNAQRDGRPAEYTWRPLFNAAKFGSDAHFYMQCSNAAKTRNQLKFGGVPQTNEMISAATGPKFTIVWLHLEDILLLNRFFPIVYTCLSWEYISRQSCAMVSKCRIFGGFWVLHFQRAHFRLAL